MSGARRGSFRAGLASAVAGVLLAALPPSPVSATPTTAPTPQECARAGAEAVERGCPVEDSGLVMPLPPLAENDRAGNGETEGCWTDGDFVFFASCTFGSPTATHSVALVGNSHAAQYLAPLRAWAERYDYTLHTFLIPKCFATTEPIVFAKPGMTERCLAWGEWVQEQVEDIDPDLIVTSERTYKRPLNRSAEGDAAVWQRGYEKYLQVWAEQARRVLVVRDSPVPRTSVPDCLLNNPNRYSVCAGERAKWLPPDPLVEAARVVDPERFRIADLSRYMCTAHQCPAVIGGMLVYRDGSHLSATWIRAFGGFLEPDFAEAFAEAVGPPAT
ncbi:MAG: SGNH hydrolase domain-containing protein [Sporichthyaceae bacterium]